LHKLYIFFQLKIKETEGIIENGHPQNNFKIAKEYSEAVIRRKTDNLMAKRINTGGTHRGGLIINPVICHE
jgi:hypothetical protein